MSEKLVVIRHSVPTTDPKIVLDIEYPIQQGTDDASPNIVENFVVDVEAAKAWLFDNPDKRIHDYVAVMLKIRFDKLKEAKIFSDQLLADPNVSLPEA